MNLKKRWVRIVISILFGAIIQEIVHIRTGQDRRAILPITAILLYAFLSFCIYFYSLYRLQRKVDQKKETNSELIDDSI